MVELATLFGSMDISQPRFHDGKFAPVKRDPQNDVKIHLEAGLTITVQQCLKLYHSTELRRIVSRLRSSGMNIGGEMYKDKNSTYKIYRLIKDGK